MTPASAHKKVYTIDDIYNLPEGNRAELIDGQIYYMVPPSTTHQRILSFLHLKQEITFVQKEKSARFSRLLLPFFFFTDYSRYLEPDISVICDRDKLNERGCQGAPDWIIEIVSPGSRAMDYYTKLSLYREAGVREYWIVDPARKIILTYDMEQAAAPVIYSFADTVKATVFDDLAINFSKLKQQILTFASTITIKL